ncbi:MAG: DUF4382 domain-containing protein, partial [Burkholderiales bacterium]
GALLLAACGGGGGGGGSTGTGTLGVSLTDSPACGFDKVYVTVSKVRVHQSSTASTSDGGWTDITLNPSRKINLLDLTNGVLDGLGETTLPAGHYTQLRLVLDRNTGSTTANSVVLSGTTTEIPLDTPSAAQSGIKLINEFDVAANQRTDLLLDFDACKSVVTRGNGSYGLKPVIKVIPFVLNGINGYIDPNLMDSTNSHHVMVFAEQNGTVVRATAPTLVNGQTSLWRFVLARLDPGDYDVVFTANGYATAVIAGVPVVSTTSTTPVSTQTQPIVLPPSGTSTVSGTVTLSPLNADVVAFVTAKQTLSPGPTVTVKSKSVDQLDGSYTLTLPTAAPLLGHYATPLPIALSDSSQTGGIYTVEASADGYTPQSSDPPLDISASNQTYSVQLTP